MKKLRSRGHRLNADQVRGGRRYAGRLQVSAEPESRLARRSDRVALLMPPMGDSTIPIDELHAMRLHRISTRGMVLVGVEVIWVRKKCTEHRQAWWVWPITPDEIHPPEPVGTYGIERQLDEIDREEEREHLEALSGPR